MIRSTLTLRVVVVLALAALIPTASLGYLAIFHARQVLEREVVRGNLGLIRALGASLDTTLQDARRTLKVTADTWADIYASGMIGPISAVKGVPAREPMPERMLTRVRRQMPLFSSLTIVDADGEILAGNRSIPDLGTGAHTFGSYIGDVVFDGGRPSVWMVAQARSRTGALVGAFLARIDLRFMSEVLAESRLPEGAELMVVDGNGIPIARSSGVPTAGSPSVRGQNTAVDRALESVVEGSYSSDKIVAVYRNLSGYQSLRGVRWAIILEQPTRDAYALARTTRKETIRICLAVLALSLFIGVFLARRLTKPLRQLSTRADAIAGHGIGPSDPGLELPPAPVDAPGEIGILAKRFEEMARRIGEREKLQSALARGDRLATVGTMAASVAHEVNNPLTTVLGYAKLLLEDKDEAHPDRVGLELIAEEAARMKGIIGNLLDYSRSERAPRPDGQADVNATLRHTAALLVPHFQSAHIHLEMKLGDELPGAAANAHALQQIFVNLLQNAAQAMPGGGTVTVESTMAPGDVAIEVHVVDQGKGVPTNVRKRIFDPFVTTKHTGTGLGLAVCKHLVTSFGGSIDVADGPSGRGARFRVVIPMEERLPKRPIPGDGEVREF